jgi:hypothetical protein
MDKPLDHIGGGGAELEATSSGTGTRKGGRGKKRSSIDRRQHSLQQRQEGANMQVAVLVPQAVSVTEKMLQDLPPPSVTITTSTGNKSSSNVGSINVVEVEPNKPCGMKREAPSGPGSVSSGGGSEMKEEVDTFSDQVVMDVQGRGDDDGDGQRGGMKRKRLDDEDTSTADADPEHAAKKRIIMEAVNRSSNASGDDSTQARAILHAAPSSSPLEDSQSSSSSFPSWFQSDSISTIEMKYIPELIVSPADEFVKSLGLKTNDDDDNTDSWASNLAKKQKKGLKYVSTRNEIVHMYHQHASNFLTATECRRKIAGDVSYIVRIHEFLDAFGIINYSPDIKTAFRNSKSAMFYATCPATKSGDDSFQRLKSEGSPGSNTNGKQTMWTDKLDQILLEAVNTALQEPLIEESKVVPRGSRESTHDVGGVDWKQVAGVLASHVDELRQVQFTSVACLVHFTEMSLSQSSVSSSSEGRSAIDVMTVCIII